METENWILCRKPLSEKTIADNVLKWGTGGINIDKSRIGSEIISTHNAPTGTFAGGEEGRGSDTSSYKEHEGRFPSNFIYTGCDEVFEEFDKAGKSKSTICKGYRNTNNDRDFIGKIGNTEYDRGFNDEGSVARFFQDINNIEIKNNYKNMEIELMLEGRFPSNFIYTGCDEVFEEFDKAGKTNKQAISKTDNKSGWQSEYVGGEVSKPIERKLYLDEQNGGSVARFFQDINNIEIKNNNESMKIKLMLGDCLEQMKKIPDNCVDSIVSDPPAGISFMGKEWDKDKGGRNEWINWMKEIMIEAKRTLKPGGHCLIWSLPRTSHWTATALEDAGFEIRDVITHVFGSGFPKSHNIGKSIDARIKTGYSSPSYINKSEMSKKTGEVKEVIQPNNGILGEKRLVIKNIGADLETDEAKQWEGWGTGLKPASENWILCRKPLSEKTIADNVLKWGTGGINIDKSRIGYEKSQECEGSSRFIYVSKPSSKEKNEGLDSFEDKYLAASNQAKAELKRGNVDYDENGGWNNIRKIKNNHPTIKSVKLMSYLCNMITPPNGIILDPFMGSGSTGVAAIKNNFNFIGIEKEQEYMDIAKARIGYAKNNLTL